jgi:hypothetical protein
MQKLGFQAGVTLELSANCASGPYLLLSKVAEQVSALPGPAPSAARNWLLLADKEGFSARFAAQLCKVLQARGDRVVRAAPGSRWAALDPLHYEIVPCDPAHYEALFSQLKASFGQLDGILHLHGLSATTGESSPLLLLDRQMTPQRPLRWCACESTKPTTVGVTAHAASGWLMRPPGQRRGPARSTNAALGIRSNPDEREPSSGSSD